MDGQTPGSRFESFEDTLPKEAEALWYHLLEEAEQERERGGLHTDYIEHVQDHLSALAEYLALARDEGVSEERLEKLRDLGYRFAMWHDVGKLPWAQQIFQQAMRQGGQVDTSSVPVTLRALLPEKQRRFVLHQENRSVSSVHDRVHLLSEVLREADVQWASPGPHGLIDLYAHELLGAVLCSPTFQKRFRKLDWSILPTDQELATHILAHRGELTVFDTLLNQLPSRIDSFTRYAEALSGSGTEMPEEIYTWRDSRPNAKRKALLDHMHPKPSGDGLIFTAMDYSTYGGEAGLIKLIHQEWNAFLPKGKRGDGFEVCFQRLRRFFGDVQVEADELEKLVSPVQSTARDFGYLERRMGEDADLSEAEKAALKAFMHDQLEHQRTLSVSILKLLSAQKENLRALYDDPSDRYSYGLMSQVVQLIREAASAIDKPSAEA